jgi:hypothetical protein
MSDTPETDEAMLPDDIYQLVWADFARKLERERNEARRREDIHYDSFIFAQREVFEMKEAIIATLEENRHLADGDDCTLAKLKSVVPEWK